MTSISIMIIGLAGSGKSHLCSSFGKWLHDNNKSFKLINLDPGADYIPYTPDFDIKKYFTISEIMKKEKLGPNGAMIHANEKINEISHKIIEKIIETGEDFILIDCPGQIESFIFRQTGVNFIQKLQTKTRVLGIYLIDSEFLYSATDFVIAALIGTACSLQLPIDVVSILHKADRIKDRDIFKNINDFKYLKNKVIEEQKGAITDMIIPILDHILSPFNRILKTSSVTGEGMEELYKLINEVFCTCGDFT